MGKRTRRLELPMLGVLFIAGVFFASAAVAVPPVINVVSGSGSQGGAGTFSATLTTNGAQVAATMNDIAFDPLTPVAVRTSGTSGNCTVTTTQACSADAECPLLLPPFDHEACVGSPLHCAVTTGQSCTTSANCPTVHEPCVNQTGPACSVNPALAPVCSNDNSQTCTQDSDCATGTCVRKSGFFTFLPHLCVGGSNAGNTCAADTDCSPGTCTGACTPGTNCTGIRAIILAVDNLGAIPDGSTLYTCIVDVSPTATVGNTYPLTISNESAGDANQALISGVTGTSGTITVLPQAQDTDGDGVPDVSDNCPYTPNPDQKDTGGIGSGSAPDGIGDVCQCGDVNGNGFVTLADSVIILRSLLTPPTATQQSPQLCDVGGSAGCTLADAVIILRANLSPPTATVSQNCAPAKPQP